MALTTSDQEWTHRLWVSEGQVTVVRASVAFVSAWWPVSLSESHG